MTTAHLTQGIFPNVDEAEYHADRTSLSHSGAKLLLKAPALFKWEQDHPTFKRVFEFGSAAHKKVLGVGPLVVEIPADVLGSNGSISTNAAKAFIALAREQGHIPVKPDELQTIDAMAARLEEHPLAMRLLQGEREVSAYCTDDATGVVRRARFDVLGTNILSDYKTAASADPDTWLRAAVKYGYHTQHAWYLDLAADLGHPAEAFAFIVQEKEPPYLVTVIEIPRELVEIGRRRNARALERFRDCTEADLWPGYVPDHLFAQPEPKPWMLREDD